MKGIDRPREIRPIQDNNHVAAYRDEFRMRDFELSAIGQTKNERAKAIPQSLPDQIQIHIRFVAQS